MAKIKVTSEGRASRAKIIAKNQVIYAAFNS